MDLEHIRKIFRALEVSEQEVYVDFLNRYGEANKMSRRHWQLMQMMDQGVKLWVIL